MTFLRTSLGLAGRLAPLCVGALVLSACPEAQPPQDGPSPPPVDTSGVRAFVPCAGRPEMAYVRGRDLFDYEGVPVRGAHVDEAFYSVYSSEPKPTCGAPLREYAVVDGAFDLAVPVPPFTAGRIEVFLDVDRDGLLDPNEPHWGEGESPPEPVAPGPGSTRRWTLGPAEFARIRHVELRVGELPPTYRYMLAAFDECGFGQNLRHPCAMYREPTPPPVPDADPFHLILRYDATSTATFEVIAFAENVTYPELHFVGPLGAPHCEVDGALARCRLTGADFTPGPAHAP